MGNQCIKPKIETPKEEIIIYKCSDCKAIMDNEYCILDKNKLYHVYCFQSNDVNINTWDMLNYIK